MAESIYDKKKRVRPARVQIRYDVEIGDAVEKKELPFVVGVVSDLSGKPEKKLEKLSKREFVEIDRDNFDSVMQGMKPRVDILVENLLTNDGSQLKFVKDIARMSDFSPDEIVQDGGPMQELMAIRNKLQDLKDRTEGNDRLDELLGALLDNESLRQKLAQATGVAGGSAAAEEAPASDDAPQQED